MSASITILGNTGREVELRYLPNGTAVANFSLASNTVRGTGENQQKKTDWFNVSAFGKQAETLAQYLEKGSSILVRGKVTFNPWLDREGTARVSADVQLQDFEFAGSGSTSRSSANAAGQTVSDSNYPAANAAGATSDDEEETAEILATLHETDLAEEHFAGQY
jgi:single-strand DNA-binding protein